MDEVDFIVLLRRSAMEGVAVRGSAAVRACLLLSGVVWSSAAPAWAAPYKITRLDGAGRLTVGEMSLNNRGQVAGAWQQDEPLPSAQYQSHPYFYDPTNGGKVTLPAIVSPSGDDPGGYDSRYFGSGFTGLNDAGRAVAQANGNVKFDSATGEFTGFSGPSGLISNSGVIYSTAPVDPINGEWNSVVTTYNSNGKVTRLDLPPGAVGAQLQGINGVGDVLVRAAMEPGYFNRSFVLSSAGTWTDLGSATGMAINDHGVVAGTLGIDSQGQLSHAALVGPDGTTTDLGTLPGDSYSIANAINNRGEAVGLSFPENANWMYRGFLYTDGKMVDLNSLIDPASGWTIRSGLAINDLGQILALGVLGDRERIMLLTPDGLATPPDAVFPDMPEVPVPEPSTLLVFGGLALGMGLARRRRRS